MLGLRAAPQLFGDARPDSGKLVDVLRTAGMAEVLPEIAEVDLNPVIASERACAFPTRAFVSNRGSPSTR
ncbi:hypothetical protein ACWDKQ_20665 [Saccharopolyspora sp. NPDC000995]